MAPINITNVLPGNSPQASIPVLFAATPASMPLPNSLSVDYLDIPGLRDTAVREYSEWQRSKVGGEMLKDQFQKACEIILMQGFDLEQVYEDQDTEHVVRSGVKRGIAQRFVGDFSIKYSQRVRSIGGVILRGRPTPLKGALVMPKHRKSERMCRTDRSLQ
jgi:hypothetical protein